MIYGDKKTEVGNIAIPDVNAIVQSNNLYPYCMNNPVNYVDPRGETVTGFGLSASAALVFGVEGQLLWVTDDSGNFALMLVGGGVSSVGLSLSGIAFTFPDMPDLYQMSGSGFGINMSIGSYGGGLIVSGEYIGSAVTAGLGAEADVMLTPDFTYTYITPINGNLADVGNWFKKAINIFLPKNLEI